MTAQETREKYFVPGSPIILCRDRPSVIGECFEGFEHGADGSGDANEIPFQVIREATFDEWLATLRPKYRGLAVPNPDFKYFYEVSVD